MPITHRSPRLPLIWCGVLWSIALAVCLTVEAVRSFADADHLPIGLRWVADFAADTPMYLPVLLLLPLAWWVKSGLVVHRSDLLRRCTTALARTCNPPNQLAPGVEIRAAPDVATRGFATLGDWTLAVAIGGISLAMSWQVSLAFGDLPPAIHDEYSYLFQAETLLAGHFSAPSHSSLPELFDQVHVVNLGRFASRYYPGTGAWLAPWVAWGHPYWGHWVAGAITAMLMFWTGRELGGSGVGVIAGLLTALSPGLALFSNLLLAHHPTLLGLSLFVFAFVRWMQHPRSISWLLVAGIGLAFAMLCRPATAAGVAFPFGVWFAAWLLASRAPARDRALATLYLAMPIAAGWGVMIAYHSAITGQWWQSPYQLYTDHYTPRHVYGFDNVPRGNAHQGPRTLPYVTRNYDAWALNLTPALAVENTWNRLLASWRWTLGIIPIVGISLAGFPSLLRDQGERVNPGQDNWGTARWAWTLIAAAIVTLHAIHIPYWFDGIMHWHYVFESSVLWILIVAGSSGLLIRHWTAQDRPWLVVWLTLLLTVGVASNYVSHVPYWIRRIEIGMVELRFPRRIYGAFRNQVRSAVTELPALVLVVPDPADRHMDLVTNSPQLSAPILFGRYVPSESPPDRLQQIAHEFSDRTLYLYDAKTRQISRVIP